MLYGFFIFLLIFIFSLLFIFCKAKPVTTDPPDSGPRRCWCFRIQGRGCGAKHYTHEAEERNKIKFWFQYVQIEIQKIIIFIFSPLASQPLWLRVFRFQVASSKFLICESSDSLFFFCFLTLSAACPSSG